MVVGVNVSALIFRTFVLITHVSAEVARLAFLAGTLECSDFCFLKRLNRCVVRTYGILLNQTRFTDQKAQSEKEHVSIYNVDLHRFCIRTLHKIKFIR
jgi:hypothetical protein